MKILALIAVGALCACESFDPQADSLECEESLDGDLEVVVTSGNGRQALGEDVRLSGTARQKNGVTIRRLTVDGIAASVDSLNYATWSVVIPAASIDPGGEAEELSDGQTVSLEIAAEDACGLTLSKTVAVEFAAPVTELSLDVAFPGEPPEGYLPANGNVPAVVTVTANREALGAIVQLAADTALSISGDSKNATVVLQAGADGEATAQVLVVGTTPGAYTMTATSHGQVAVTPLRVAGAPTFLPSQVVLSPGQTVGVVVSTTGSVDSCQASPSGDITVTTGGQDISVTPAAMDTSGDGFVDLVISAAPAATVASSVTVTCRDPFGQTATATFQLVP